MKTKFDCNEIEYIVEIIANCGFRYFEDRDSDWCYFSKSIYNSNNCFTDYTYSSVSGNLNEFADIVWESMNVNIEPLKIKIPIPEEFRVCLTNWLEDVTTKGDEREECLCINHIYQKTGYGYYSSIELFGSEEEETKQQKEG